MPKSKQEYVFWFIGTEGLIRLNDGHGRDKHIFYSPNDYDVVEERQQRPGGLTVAALWRYSHDRRCGHSDPDPGRSLVRGSRGARRSDLAARPLAVFENSLTGDRYDRFWQIPFGAIEEIFVYRNNADANVWDAEGAFPAVSTNTMIDASRNPRNRPMSRPRPLEINRRTVLRGAGVAMALPWLESLPVWGGEVGGAAPKRFAALFMGNGISPNHWWAKGSGAGMELSKTLQPLAPLRSKLNVVSGLFNKHATGVGIHPGQTGNILSGAALQKGAVLKGGVSMDQVLAARVGEDTPQPSLVLGCEQPITGYHETNFSMAYSSHISWQDAASPVPMEVYPSLAFDSLFDNQGSQRARSILDRVQEHAAHLSRQVSHADRAKLDEYLNSVREVEKQVERTRAQKDRADDRARDRGRPALAMKRPDNGLPEDIREHMRLMCDIIALAFQTDKTRVATLLLCRDLSGLFYPFLDVRSAHHPASHDDQSDAYERVAHYYVSQLAYLATRLDAMPEGDGTVLDNSCLLFISNMWSGSRHDSTKLPVLLAGGLGGALETGRVLDFTGRDNDDRKLCSLYLSLMDRMDVKLDHFGDADTRLAGL